jgi:hypothetical protein
MASRYGYRMQFYSCLQVRDTNQQLYKITSARRIADMQYTTMNILTW